jgi:uronate dehydrogenase
MITGAAGLIGSLLTRGLESGRDIAGLDIRPGQASQRLADMRRPDEVRAAFTGVDTVIDLAANSDAAASWPEIQASNLPVSINTLEAAREAGVRRVILASSNHVTGLVERDEPYRSVLRGRYRGLDHRTLPRVSSRDPVRPDGPYGIAKAMAEAAGRHYAESHGISVLCLRIGTVNAADRPTNPRHFSTLLTHRDLLALVRCCLDAPPELRFGIYFGVSANRWRIWDIENARTDLGYAPADDSERWR